MNHIAYKPLGTSSGRRRHSASAASLVAGGAAAAASATAAALKSPEKTEVHQLALVDSAGRLSGQPQPGPQRGRHRLQPGPDLQLHHAHQLDADRDQLVNGLPVIQDDDDDEGGGGDNGHLHNDYHDHHDGDCDDDDDDDEADDRYDYRYHHDPDDPAAPPPPSNLARLRYHSALVTGALGFRQLRLALYGAAVVLSLIFITQLSSQHKSRTLDQNGPQSETAAANGSALAAAAAAAAAAARGLQRAPAEALSSRSPPPSSPVYNLVDDSHHSIAKQPKPTRQQHPGEQHHEPQYYNYLSYVTQQAGAHSPGLLDDLSGPFELGPDGGHSATATSWWRAQHRTGPGQQLYVTLMNYVRSTASQTQAHTQPLNSTVTLTTQASTEFVYHALELCKRWDGPISMAVYGPGYELQVALTLIKYMRECLPGPLSACVRDKITWSVAYDAAHGPKIDQVRPPHAYVDGRNYPMFARHSRCPKLAGPQPADAIRQLELELRAKNAGQHNTTFRKQAKLAYPINVLRNTARLAATSEYILASDVELYPSINLATSFASYLARSPPQNIGASLGRFIWTLPIFELDSAVQQIPRTKPQLVQLFRQGQAIFFHKWVCDACQNFPNRLEWLNTDKLGIERYHHEPPNELCVFEVTKRDKSRSMWEPIYIGTQREPFYDDRLTWDGRRDKMGQMYELCLENYSLLVLGNAYLVHAPGVKHIDKADVIARTSYIRENNAIYDSTMTELKRRYANSPTINDC